MALGDSRKSKHWLGSWSWEERRRRDSSGRVEQASSAQLQSKIEPLRKLASLGRHSAEQILSCLGTLTSVQAEICRGFDEFLQTDPEGLDDHAKVLTRVCLDFFRDSEAFFSKRKGLMEISASCDQVLQDCEHLAEVVRSKEQARQEAVYYEQKVDRLKKRPGQILMNSSSGDDGDGDDDDQRRLVMPGSGRSASPLESLTGGNRLCRNVAKLDHAKEIQRLKARKWQEELAEFRRLRTMYSRALLHGLLRDYVHVLAQWGRCASTVAKAFDEELKPGTLVEVAGLVEKATLPAEGLEFTGGGERFREAKATAAFVEGLEPETGRCIVVLPGGQRTAVRPEQLCPLPYQAYQADEPVPLGEVALKPSRMPCSEESGKLYEAEVICSGLEGQITEVLVDGKHVDILSASSKRARVLLPAQSTAGSVEVEVRSADWQQRLARSEAALHYFEPVGFGQHGHNVDLSHAPGLCSAVPTVATRRSGIVHGLALTAAPLRRVMKDTQDGIVCKLALEPREVLVSSPSLGEPSPLRHSKSIAGPASQVFCVDSQFYFEAVMRDVAQDRRGTVRTLAVGFVWDSKEPKAQLARKSLPEMSRDLPRSFLVGGDLLRLYLDGEECRKVHSWRPLVELQADTVLGVLLEMNEAQLRLIILQDGVVRLREEVPRPANFDDSPYGVVDVCGTVRCVELRQCASIPERCVLDGQIPRLDSSTWKSSRGHNRASSVESISSKSVDGSRTRSSHSVPPT